MAQGLKNIEKHVREIYRSYFFSCYRSRKSNSYSANQGCYLINLGDMLSKQTNSIYVLIKHRVIYNSTKAQVSNPFFFDPNIDAIISPILPLNSNSHNNKGILFREKFVNSIKYSIVTWTFEFKVSANNKQRDQLDCKRLRYFSAYSIPFLIIYSMTSYKCSRISRTICLIQSQDQII